MTNDTIELTIRELKELETDSRGRAYLGGDYKDSTVKVAIVEVQEAQER